MLLVEVGHFVSVSGIAMSGLSSRLMLSQSLVLSLSHVIVFLIAV